MRPDEKLLRAWALDGMTGYELEQLWEGHPKRLWYLLGRWTNNGWWDYGVSVRAGWITPEGKDAFSGGEQ